MPVEFKNEVIIPLLRQHMKGKTKESINFYFEHDTTRIQSSSTFIFDTIVPNTSEHEYIGKQFSIMFTTALQMLRDEHGITRLDKRGEDIIVVEQDNISIPFSASPEERIEISFSGVDELGKVPSYEFVNITRRARSMLSMSKSLDAGVSPIIVSSGSSYCAYSNVICVKPVNMVLPDVEIPYNTFSNLSKNLGSLPVKLYVDTTKRILLVETNDNAVAMLTYKKPNYDFLMAIDSRMNELESIGIFDITAFEPLDNLQKSFPNESITLSMYNDSTVGAIFSIGDGKSIRAGVKSLDTILNVVLSTTQFDVVYRMFKGTSKVEVSKGRDLVCFKGTDKTTLLLSGMTF